MKLLNRLYERLGFNALVSERYETARKYFLKIQRRTNGAMGTRHNLGMVDLARENFHRAFDYFLAEMKNFGENYARAKVLADVCYALGEAEKGLTYYRLAKGLAAGEKDLPQVLARIQICQDEERFKAARQSHPLCKKGIAAEKNREVSEALELYDKAIAKDPTNIQALNNAGACCQRLKKPKKAVEHFKKAYELSGLPAIGQNLKKMENTLR